MPTNRDVDPDVDRVVVAVNAEVPQASGVQAVVSCPRRNMTASLGGVLLSSRSPPMTRLTRSATQ